METAKKTILSLLETVMDPEVPVLSVVDLGIIREVKWAEGRPEIVITPTYSGCPAMDVIRMNIRMVLIQNGYPDVKLTTVLSPAWTTDLVNGDHFIFASSSPAAIAGYPAISLPMGNSFGLPVGITFMGTAFSEPTLIKLASGFEHAAGARLVPQFLPGLPFDSVQQNGNARNAAASAEATMAQMSRMRTNESEKARLSRARGR